MTVLEGVRLPSRPKHKVKVNTTGIIAAIWAGLFTFNAIAAFLLSGQLFVLILVTLALGSVLTFAVLRFAYNVAALPVKQPKPRVKTNSVRPEPEHMSSYYDDIGSSSSGSGNVDTDINLGPPP